MIYILLHTIESYKFVGKYGIFRIDRMKSSWGKSCNINFYMVIKELLFLDAVIDFPKKIILTPKDNQFL